MFGKLLEEENDLTEMQLTEIEKNIRDTVEKAKNISLSCEITNDTDINFMTKNGVTHSLFRS